jgi:uncharacterized protein YjbI with pentapeptide repeats
MEILTAFVREHASWKPGDAQKPIQTDIQAVLTVLGRRNTEHEFIGVRRSLSESRTLDLRRTNLQEADLRGANLAHANLAESNLTQSKMLGTNMWSAILINADLSDSNIMDSIFKETDLNGTQFKRAELFTVKFDSPTICRSYKEPTNFEGATLTACSLRHTNFLEGNFKNAKFNGGSLKGAKLKGADFTGASFDAIALKEVDLSEVKGLVIEQIVKEGVEYEEANLPIHIRQLLSRREHIKHDTQDKKTVDNKDASANVS